MTRSKHAWKREDPPLFCCEISHQLKFGFSINFWVRQKTSQFSSAPSGNLMVNDGFMLILHVPEKNVGMDATLPWALILKFEALKYLLGDPGCIACLLVRRKKFFCCRATADQSTFFSEIGRLPAFSPPYF